MKQRNKVPRQAFFISNRVVASHHSKKRCPASFDSHHVFMMETLSGTFGLYE